MAWNPLPVEIDSVRLFTLAHMDFEKFANGFSTDSYCGVHGRHGNGEGPCICDRWWACPKCGETTWGLFCHECGFENKAVYQEPFVSMPNPKAVAWQKWKAGGPYQHEITVGIVEFEKILNLRQTFVILENNTGIAVGDLLVLKLSDTGQETQRIATSVLSSGEVQKVKDIMVEKSFDETGTKSQIPCWIQNFPWNTLVVSLGAQP